MRILRKRNHVCHPNWEGFIKPESINWCEANQEEPNQFCKNMSVVRLFGEKSSSGWIIRHPKQFIKCPKKIT